MPVSLDSSLPAPRAPRRPFVQHWHDRQRCEYYVWMRAENWLEVLTDPSQLATDIHAQLEAENRYAESVLGNTVGLQLQLTAELRGRMQENESQVPEWDGPFAYFWQYRKNGEYPVLVRVAAESASEQVVLDLNNEAEGHEYFDLGDYEVSPDHRWLVWTVDTAGSEIYNLRFREIDSGVDLDKQIDRVDTVTWIDSEHLLYSKLDENLRAHEVFRHCLSQTDSDFDGADQNDVCLLVENDPAFDLGVGRMRSGRYVEIAANAEDQSEVYLLDTRTPLGTPWVFHERSPRMEYSLDHQLAADGREHFYILTNMDGATNNKIMITPVVNPGIEHWREYVPASASTLIDSMDVFANWVVWTQVSNAQTVVRYRSNEGIERTLGIAQSVYELEIYPSPEFASDTLRVTMESPQLVPRVYDIDLHSQEWTLKKETLVPTGHDPEKYSCRRFWATSADGTRVPVTCLYRQDIPFDGTAPGVIEAYGSYGASSAADFCTDRLSLVDRGVVYAIAHIRGGQEMGRQWYEDAKGAAKKHSFQDFIACTEYLSEAGIVEKGRMVCLGGSAGGLVIGAVLNEAPGLYAGAVAQVPFVDVLSTLLDDTHPLTPGEWPQWGNPLLDPEAYRWIEEYSPIDNIKAQDYPPVFVTAGISDPRVGYWEPAKWVMELRHQKTDDNPVMLSTNMGTGHGGATGRYESLAETAKEYAFILSVLELDDPV